MVPETHRDLLGLRGFAHLATVSADGLPQTTPMWYLWDGERLVFSTLKRRRKCTNLRRNPRVAVSIADPENPYRYLQIQGVAEVADDDRNEVIGAVMSKYFGDDIAQWDEPGEERVVIRVRPMRVVSFG